jgi:hypothetical protein
MNEAEYKRAFGIDPPQKELLTKALEHALDIRKFEIELYWKRATYFWTLIAVAFAGYFVILGSQYMDEKKFMAFVVACIGFLFTFAWFQVNRGSKRWQENWENHVDMLEDSVTGPLYKTVLSRPPGDGPFERLVTGPAEISVSKTNQIVNLFTLFIWLVLAFVALEPLALDQPVSAKRVVVAIFTIIFCLLILRKGKTWLGAHTHRAHLRETKVES